MTSDERFKLRTGFDEMPQMRRRPAPPERESGSVRISQKMENSNANSFGVESRILPESSKLENDERIAPSLPSEGIPVEKLQILAQSNRVPSHPSRPSRPSRPSHPSHPSHPLSERGAGIPMHIPGTPIQCPFLPLDGSKGRRAGGPRRICEEGGGLTKRGCKNGSCGS